MLFKACLNIARVDACCISPYMGMCCGIVGFYFTWLQAAYYTKSTLESITVYNNSILQRKPLLYPCNDLKPQSFVYYLASNLVKSDCHPFDKFYIEFVVLLYAL